MPTRTLWALCGCLWLVPVAASLGDDSSQDEKQARAATEQFLKGLKDKDAARLAKVVGVPWLAEGRRTVQDLNDLDKLLRDGFARPTSLDGLEIKALVPAGEVRKEVPEEARKVLDEVVGKGGYVAILARKEPPALLYVLVRVKDGQAKVVGGPYKFTYLLQPNDLPKAAAEALDQAESLEVYSLDPSRVRPKPGEEKEDKRETFHGFRVYGKATVKDPDTRKKLVAAFKAGVEDSIGAAALCFNPRHGIRVTHNGKTFDFVICFECLQIRVYEGETEGKTVLTADSPQPVFDKILREAKVPLAEKP
jgi:hypothetical protein